MQYELLDAVGKTVKTGTLDENFTTLPDIIHTQDGYYKYLMAGDDANTGIYQQALTAVIDVGY